MKSNTESGNVLFIILIAIVLFGALSFAVSNMMRSGNAEAVSEQRASILADEILAQARDIRQSVQNLRISNGCEDADISFENSTLTGYGHSPAARDECKVYHPDGGGLNYLKPNEEWLDSANSSNGFYRELFFTSGACVIGLGADASESSCYDDASTSDLILLIPYINSQICLAIAQKTNVLNSNDAIPIDSVLAWNSSDTKFTGAYITPKQIINESSPDSSRSLEGKPVGCFITDDATTNIPSGTLVFYQVLIPR